MKNLFLNFWYTDKLPKVHIKVAKGSPLTIYLLRWFIHPIKRRVARCYFSLLRKVTKITVIGITGSAGKTTTKEMLAAILKLEGKTGYSHANIDPVYNIPSTLLKCNLKTRYLILEMGVEYPKEMDFYLWFVVPDVGIITNIFPTHTEFFGDVNGVFAEKSKLVRSMDVRGIAVLNKNDNKLKTLSDQLKAKIIWFNSENSDAAKVTAEILGASPKNIEYGLKNYEKPPHRNVIIRHASGAVIFDDSYNSNPEAFLTTLDHFNRLAVNNVKIAVLGDMKELGKIEESEHRRVGKEVAKSNFKVVFGVGKAIAFLLNEISIASPNTVIYHIEKAEDVLPKLKDLLKNNVYVLIKGSRSIGLDKIADSL